MNLRDTLLPRLLPLAVALALFFGVSALYFAPQFRGEVLPQHDVQQYDGMTRDILLERAASGEDPQWTGRMFGGMPAYLINVAYPAQLVKATVGQLVALVGRPAGFLFFAMLSMWLMLLIVGVNPWVGMVPSLAYGLSTYFLLIIGAGHVTKMWALVYAPLMMGGIWMTLRRNKWLGAALAALCASLEIGANHPQITYYFLLAAALFWLSEGIHALRSRHGGDFLRRSALLLLAGALAVGSNFSPLWYTARHSAQTMRGGSELARDETATGGLDLEYATAWSYGRTESWNLMIPDFMGGDSGTTFAADGATARALAPYGLEGLAAQLPRYWGDQPYTAGPTYLGAAALLLALMGLLLAPGRCRWWLLGACLLMLLLAWGRHLAWFTRLAFDYLPLYNKFRTVSMTLTVVQWAVPVLAAVALMRMWQGIPRERLLRAWAWAAGLTGGLCLLFAVAGGSLFDFGERESADFLSGQYYRMFQSAGMEEAIAQGMPEELADATAAGMAAERAAVMRADAWRSLVMILLASGAVLLFAGRRIGRGVLVAALGVVVLADMVPVDLRYLSHDRFVAARRQRITASAADRQIMQDKDPAYRVLNLTVSPFNDATTSYFHRSVGGYHGAKLARYQDLIDRYLTRLDENVLDMLNTRYLVRPGAQGEPVAERRPTANGPAWLVGEVLHVAGAEAEISALDGLDTRRTAVVDRRFLPLLAPLTGEQAARPDPTAGTEAEARHPASASAGSAATAAPLFLPADTAAVIRLTEYRPQYQRYAYRSSAPSLAVFSEIYYDKGWNAYVDGQQVPYLRADYVLRALPLPAGEHTVEWRFRAPAWRAVEAVTLICSLAVLTGALAALIYAILRHERRPKTQA